MRHLAALVILALCSTATATDYVRLPDHLVTWNGSYHVYGGAYYNRYWTAPSYSYGCYVPGYYSYVVVPNYNVVTTNNYTVLPPAVNRGSASSSASPAMHRSAQLVA